ncbi:MAG: PadR family transcriptional regulator [Chloroflexi bacterium]|nr:PadR family transcriptional regulator [Chloroflexota bacterium]
MADMKDPDYWDTAILRAAGRLLMLAAFDERPGHGYDIARRLSSLCGAWCNPSAAMIYPAIHELEAAGLIACEAASNTRGRRVCSLTADGREALQVGLAAWARFLPAMERVLAASGDPSQWPEAASCGAAAEGSAGPSTC